MNKRTQDEQIGALVRIFAISVTEQAEQIDHGTASRGNKAARRRIAAFKKLRDLYGDHGREALKGLLSHENEGVRCTAAAYLLRYCTDDAMAVLADIAKNGSGFDKIGAFYCIKNWEEGTWELDPEPSAADEGGGDGTEPPSSDC